jgi:hypothetical protein
LFIDVWIYFSLDRFDVHTEQHAKKKTPLCPCVLYLQRRENAFYTNMHGTSPKKGQTKGRSTPPMPHAPLQKCRNEEEK